MSAVEYAGSSMRTGITPEIHAFTEELPLERRSIARFVLEAAQATPPGSAVLDAGAGNAPYRPLFSHTDYKTADWPNSVHAGASLVDIEASLDDIPVDDGTFDTVLCTQVLEHVPDPLKVVSEFNRVLRPGGTMWLTIPLVWPLHEDPYDFYRYTPYGLQSLLERAGFEEIEIRPRNGYYTTMSQLAAMVHWQGAQQSPSPARPPALKRIQRRLLRGTVIRMLDALAELGPRLYRLDALNEGPSFPLGYEVRAQRPG